MPTSYSQQSTIGPMPAPPLDGVPPSNPALGPSSGPNPSIQQLSPGAQLGGDMQTTQLLIQAGAKAAQLIDMIGQAAPNFAPTAQMIISQLRSGLKSALQQGTSGQPEPAAGAAQQGFSMMQNPDAGQQQ